MNNQNIEDYIVVKTLEEAKSLMIKKAPKSLQGKYIIVAPNGLKFVSKEDITKLPQVKALLIAEQRRSAKELFKIKQIYNAEMTAQVKKERTSLLGEVREKVIGKDEEENTHYIALDRANSARNDLRAEQRTKLSSLEDVGGGK